MQLKRINTAKGIINYILLLLIIIIIIIIIIN